MTLPSTGEGEHPAAVTTSAQNGSGHGLNGSSPRLDDSPHANGADGQTIIELNEELRQAYTPSPDGTKRPAATPEPLPDGLLPVEPFDLDLLPEPLRAWAEEIVTTFQAPSDFVAVGVMTGLGAVLGRRVGVRPQMRTSWTEVLNQWGLIIGRPGIIKSPTLEATLAPVKWLAARAVSEHGSAVAEQKENSKIAELRAAVIKQKAKAKLRKDLDADVSDFLEEEANPPTLRRYITSDATPASLGQLLIENPNGVLVHRDEIVSLLQSFEREDNAEGRGLYLTGWGGNSSHTMDRIVRGMNLHIPAVCISLLGTTQPGKIATYLGGAVRGGAGDDGLIQRFGLMVWPDVSPDWEDVDRTLNDVAKRRAFKVYERLDQLDPRSVEARQDYNFDNEPEGVPYLRFDAEAHERFVDWRGDLEHRVRSGNEHPAIESHLAKYRGLVPSLALIIHLAENGTGTITEPALSRALRWARYLESHARRAYASVTMPEVSTAKAIVGKLKEEALGRSEPTIQNGVRRFTLRDVLRPKWSRLSDRDQVQSGLDLLVEYGWLDTRDEKTGGRPIKWYIVNPAIGI